MRRAWKNCPECETTITPGRCKLCGNSGSIPLCPPVAEPVVYKVRTGDRVVPMIVTRAVMSEVDGKACVMASGIVFFSREITTMKENIPGPSEEPGHWNWRGDPA